ncbi:MAG: hypothetical protein ACE5MB_02100 [Anaerolineae bacterium]
MIENIPVVSCLHGGESYLAAETCMKLSASNSIERALPLNALWRLSASHN